MKSAPRAGYRRALLGIVAATGACFAYRPVETAPAPGSRVRIVLTTAMEVTTVTPAGAREAHVGVLEANGTIQASSADTVALRLGELRTASGILPGLAGQTALLPAAGIARMEQRRFQAVNTALAGIGVVTLAVAAFLVVIIVTLTKGF